VERASAEERAKQVRESVKVQLESGEIDELP